MGLIKEGLSVQRSKDQSAPPVAIMNNEVMNSYMHNADQPQRKLQIVWRNIFIAIYAHLIAFYGLYLFCKSPSFLTFIWTLLWEIGGLLGLTAGGHRLWAHRTYKATLPLRIFLCFLQSLAFQNSIYEWCRDHRVHHKYVDTDADPHNASRGFFFSHMGWLMVKKHSDVITKGRTIDLSDLEADPIVRFQRKYFLLLGPLCCFVLPALGPWYFWGESGALSWYFCAVFRYVFSLHSIWLINSWAHMYGTKPYDKNIRPTESKFVSYFAGGEGFHNYHHTFPWDYKAAELGSYDANLATALIDLMAKIGWAYDLRTPSKEMVENQARKRGDGTRNIIKEME